MFKSNKYTQIYYNIVERSKSRTLEGYVERHHIIPRSLGGSDSQDNIAILTAREHYVCHLLLTKMTSGRNKQKMFYALHRLTNHSKHIVPSRIYQYIRENHSRQVSKQFKGKTYLESRGKKYAHEISEYQRQRIRESNAARVWSEESKRRVSESQKRRYKERPESFKGHKWTAESRHKMSVTKKKSAKRYVFMHKDGSVFEGSRSELAEHINSKACEIWKLTRGRYKSYKGWSLKT